MCLPSPSPPHLTLSAAKDGSHSVAVKACDAGNWVQNSSLFSWIYDHTPPASCSAALVGVNADAEVSNQSTVLVELSCPEARVQFTVTVDNATSTVLGSGPVSIGPSGKGKHSLLAWGYRRGGEHVAPALRPAELAAGHGPPAFGLAPPQRHA